MNDFYSINKLMQDRLLYLHFDAKIGYSFKVSLLGACYFRHESAQRMLADIFNHEPTITIMKMSMGQDCEIIKVPDADLVNLQNRFARSQKRRRYRQRKRTEARERLNNVQQGPAEEDDVEDEPVPPSP